MSKIDRLIKELCPNGVEYRKLKEIGETFTGLSGKSKDDFSNGNSRYITYTNIYNNLAVKLNLDDKVFIKDNENQNILKYGDILIAGSSENIEDSGMISVVCEEPRENIYLNSFCFGFRLNDNYTKKLLPDFSKHIFRSANFRSQILSCSFGVTRYNLNKKMFLELTIPIPPIEVQEEIVRILDKFGELEAELEAELETRKSQYEFWRGKLFESKEEMEYKRLDELFPYIRNGFVGTVTPFFTNAENGVRYLEGTNIHNGVISDNEVLYVTKEFHQKHIKNELKEDDILMVQSGHIGECAEVGEKYKGSNCHALIILSNGGLCISKYIVHYFHTKKGFESLNPAITGGTIKHVLAGKIGKVKVPYKSLKEQQRIVNILDKFDKLVNDINEGLPAEIEARRKQYAYYRNKLLSFEELVVSE